MRAGLTRTGAGLIRRAPPPAARSGGKEQMVKLAATSSGVGFGAFEPPVEAPF